MSASAPVASQAALASAIGVLDSVQLNGVANGNYVFNTASASSSHVRARAQWVMRAQANGDVTNATLVDHICWMARVNEDAATVSALGADAKLPLEVAVVLALGRCAAWRYFGMTSSQVHGAEAHVIPAADAEMTVHADHDAAVAAAIGKWSMMTTRLPGIMWYNALSYEGCNHHHLPDVTKKLATTTITLLGMEEWFKANVAADFEGLVMHDMYHMAGHDLKASLARNTEWAAALHALGFSNLAKRVPIKDPDTALAINYPELIRKARGFIGASELLPSELDAPAELLQAVATYSAAQTADQARHASAELRAMATHLAEPSVFLAGFMYGREILARDEPDLTFKAAAKTNTILGSPAYKREMAEYPGAFNLGQSVGGTKPSAKMKTAAKDETMVNIRHGMALAVHARAVARSAVTGDPVPPVPVRPVARGWFATA